MDLHEIAAFTHAHQLAILKMGSDDSTVSEHSDNDLCQHLDMEFSRGMKTLKPEIKRDHNSPLEFSCYRGHQHTHLQHAVKSFLVHARGAYIAHLDTVNDERFKKLDVSILAPLFVKPDHKISGQVFTSTENAYFYFVHDNVAHHIRLHLTVKRGVAKTYSGNLQVIVHHFDLAQCGGSDESVETIHERLIRLVSNYCT